MLKGQSFSLPGVGRPSQDTPCIQFHRSSVGNECEKDLLKMLRDFIPRAGSMHCAHVLDCVQDRFLWESVDSEGMAPSFGTTRQQPG